MQVKVFHTLDPRKCRGSRPEMLYKKSVYKNLAKFTGKHFCLSPYFNINKVAG